ncbi:MAG: sensor histidine kinase, partial [Desulfovibrionaceae bacterium]
SDRAEVAVARKGGVGLNRRPSPTLASEMIYVARQVPASAGLPAGILRVAVPVSRIQERSAAFRDSFLVIFSLALIVSLLASFLLSRRVIRSVSVFSEMARDIGRGRLSRRLGPIPGGEFRGLAETINQMAENIEDHVRLIESQRGQLAAILESMGDGVMVLNAEGRIEVANRALGRMFPGVAEFKGKAPIEALRDLEIQHAAEVLLAQPWSEKASLRIQTSDGRPVEVQGCVIEAPLEAGRRRRQAVFVFRDLSEAKRSEKVLKDFLANASHQLKTPLTSVRGYAETLLDSPPDDPAQARKFLERILGNARLMARLINSLLQLVKSDRPRARTDIQPVNVSRVLESVLDGLAYPIETKRLEVRREVPRDMEVLGTETDLELVLSNLLENAARHSPEEGVITVQGRRENGATVLTVSDQGPGMSLSIRERVFEPFFRADPNPVNENSGAGLGLTICRRTVERLGGEIHLCADPSPTAGATFVVRLKTAV